MGKKETNRVCVKRWIVRGHRCSSLDRNAEKRDDENDDDNRYDTPNLRGTRGKVEIVAEHESGIVRLESPSRAQWDDDDADKRRSQWEHPSPNDGYNRQGYRKRRDTDYYNRYGSPPMSILFE